MFKWLEKLLGRNTESDGIFPPAEEVRIQATAVWPVMSAQEILKEINIQKDQGYMEVIFFNVIIEEEVLKELKEKHYKVRPAVVCQGYHIAW